MSVQFTRKCVCNLVFFILCCHIIYGKKIVIILYKHTKKNKADVQNIQLSFCSGTQKPENTHISSHLHTTNSLMVNSPKQFNSNQGRPPSLPMHSKLPPRIYHIRISHKSPEMNNSSNQDSTARRPI